ncbi:MAG: CoA transferase [Gemmatimonadales bacterium]|nr:CoA transferase [Gemmatimonadales bacterium]MYG50222.1 CoA transferase [Gemmatimonadales bacterium]MYK01866.1 CoA transferase [Candidatus Palauibacter ramosifaciens]
MSDAGRPLAGVRVVALEQYMSAPYCSLLLADAGAEVIKIERPGLGDPRRSIPPFVERNGVRMGVGFMAYNRNKKSLALNLKSDEGRDLYRSLVSKSDVVVENLRPGSVDRMGLGYEALSELNPRLVYAAVSGFGRLPGREGPYGDWPSFDVVAEAMGGVMHMIGFADKPPSPSIYGMPDLYAGMAAAHGVSMALYRRTVTGKGQFIDSAMYDGVLSLNERMVSLAANTGARPRRGDPPGFYPRGPMPVSDGYVAFTIPDDIMWRRFCRMLERPDLLEDPRLDSPDARTENRALLDEVVRPVFAELTRDEAVRRLQEVGVPAGPVQTSDDLLECPQLEARGVRVTVDYDGLGELEFVRTPLLTSDAPDVPVNPAPTLGRDTRQILTELLDLPDAEVSRLAEDAVVGTAAA